jgi:hypothetical protein
LASGFSLFTVYTGCRRYRNIQYLKIPKRPGGAKRAIGVHIVVAQYSPFRRLHCPSNASCKKKLTKNYCFHDSKTAAGARLLYGVGNDKCRVDVFLIFSLKLFHLRQKRGIFITGILRMACKAKEQATREDK